MNVFNVRQILKNARSKGEISSLETLVLLEKRSFELDELVCTANEINEKLNGKIVTYVKGKKIYYTNICRAKCRFCSFYTMKSRKDAFEYTKEEIVKTLKKERWIRQLTLQGGLNPDLDLNYHVDLVKAVRDAFPRLYIQAYTPTEVAFFARRSRCSPKDVLTQLKNAGVDSLSGDSAEVLNDKLRKKIRQDKIKVSEWIEILKMAHKLSMPTPVSLVVGHIETGIHISEHLDLLSALQKETGFVTNLIISPFVPNGTVLARERKLPAEIDFERLLYVTAIARLSVGQSIRHITVDWTKVTREQLQRVVSAGANDLGLIEVDRHELTNGKNKPAYSLNLKQAEKDMHACGKILMQRNPYSIKKPKFVYKNESYIVEAELVKRS